MKNNKINKYKQSGKGQKQNKQNPQKYKNQIKEQETHIVADTHVFAHIGIPLKKQLYTQRICKVFFL